MKRLNDYLIKNDSMLNQNMVKIILIISYPDFFIQDALEKNKDAIVKIFTFAFIS